MKYIEPTNRSSGRAKSRAPLNSIVGPSEKHHIEWLRSSAFRSSHFDMLSQFVVGFACWVIGVSEALRLVFVGIARGLTQHLT